MADPSIFVELDITNMGWNTLSAILEFLYTHPVDEVQFRNCLSVLNQLLGANCPSSIKITQEQASYIMLRWG